MDRVALLLGDAGDFFEAAAALDRAADAEEFGVAGDLVAEHAQIAGDEVEIA